MGMTKRNSINAIMYPGKQMLASRLRRLVTCTLLTRRSRKSPSHRLPRISSGTQSHVTFGIHPHNACLPLSFLHHQSSVLLFSNVFEFIIFDATMQPYNDATMHIHAAKKGKEIKRSIPNVVCADCTGI